MEARSPAPALPSPPQCGHYEILHRGAPAALAGHVTSITCYRESVPGHFRQIEPASLDIPLIIGFDGPFAIGIGHTPGPSDTVTSFASGLAPRNVVIDSFGSAHCLQINFTPLGAYRFFGLPMHELNSRLIAPDDLLGPAFAELRQRLGEEADWNRRADLAAAFVIQRLGKRPATASPAIAAAYAALVGSGGRLRVETLARRLDVSRKHLAHRFSIEVGANPKTVARIVRFNSALAKARAQASPDWADIALECGYADQAHLVREFRDFAGCSPVRAGQMLM
ncbi:helix-turn-helix domain-containing protein [Mesorhizobium xinjiangense]|uniref:helix-turn-helix domain-containing protein n=1 Tax=Mesorhizobium xinjiangense TaxID=2678685 RepID=UPI0012ED37AC|nr:helix-turn-helix domain-containing protein [Mesorhizobium xinjiangense]